MDILVLDSTYELLDIVDTYESFIWTERYRGYGDFELYLPVEKAIPSLLTKGNYLSIRNSDRLMIIEDIAIDTNAEDGNKLTVTGRSLESILERRVIWGQAILNENLQNGICGLITDNIINPINESRAIPEFYFSTTSDPSIVDIPVDTQFFGDNLYDSIVTLCEEHGLGFSVLPYGLGGFVFSLYNGTDRSYSQDVNPWIVFSPKMDNIISSNYFSSEKEYKNAALSAGEGEGTDRVLAEAVIDEHATGLDRHEIYVDSSSISKKIDEGVLTEDQYLSQLREKGFEGLYATEVTESFEGEIDATGQYRYGIDFGIGDIVQIVNEYGMTARSRVTEVVRSHSSSGETTLPTFSTL